MKYFPMMLTAFTVLRAGVILATKDEQKHVQEVRGVESRLADSHQLIQVLVSANSKVLDQFNAFSHTLAQAYVSGEGFIQMDIYRILDALSFAAEKHRFQYRKDRDQTPYIIHPMGVANNLMEIGRIRDPEIIIAALLHDTVEDTQTTFEEIERAFGARVAMFVKEVTDDKSLPKHVRKQLQIESASKKSAGAAQIKLADKLYNLTDLLKTRPLDWDDARVEAYFGWSKSVVDSLPWVNSSLKQAVDRVIKEYWQAKETVDE